MMNKDNKQGQGWEKVLKDFVKSGAVSPETIAKYQGRVSEEIIYLWENYGYGSFYHGFFKLINPESFEELFGKLVHYLNPVTPIMITGMGDMIAAEDDKEDFDIYLPRYDSYDWIHGGLSGIAEVIEKESFQWEDLSVDSYLKAVDKYGIPNYDSCFSYTVPLGRGGYEDVEHIEAVPVKEFLLHMYDLQGQYDWSNKMYAPVSKKDKNFTYEIHKDTVNITRGSILIGDKAFPAPMDINAVMDYVEQEQIKGIEGNRETGVLSIWFGLSDKENYNGTLLVEGEPWVYAKRKPTGEHFQKQMLEKFSIEYWLKGRKLLNWVDIKAFDEKRYKAIVEKYKIPKLAEETLEFKDFNFKLMVIQELMYEQNLLEPKFDIEAFAEQCKDEIDLQSEEPIDEAVKYFKKLPIPKSMAERITALNVDGGNEIYAEVSPGWDGEDDWYVVKKGTDALQFPNLKKADDMFFSDKAKKELMKQGISMQ